MKKSTKKLVNICLGSFAQGIFLGDAVKTISGKNNIESPIGLICRLGIDVEGLVGTHTLNKANTAEYFSAVLEEMEINGEKTEDINIDEED